MDCCLAHRARPQEVRSMHRNIRPLLSFRVMEVLQVVMGSGTVAAPVVQACSSIDSSPG